MYREAPPGSARRKLAFRLGTLLPARRLGTDSRRRRSGAIGPAVVIRAPACSWTTPGRWAVTCAPTSSCSAISLCASRVRPLEIVLVAEPSRGNTSRRQGVPPSVPLFAYQVVGLASLNNG